ncbi:MAG: FAD:protein FMN transferase [Porticoccaceae bacterium]|nr:FAD:protein FMN transferase [Porticoccaceae bacterium]
MQTIKRCKPLLGTYVSVHIRSDENSATLMELTRDVFSEIEEIEKSMSFHDPESELSYLNQHAADHPCELSEDMATVLTTALTLSRLSRGRYDISVAPQLIKNGHLPEIPHAALATACWRDIELSENVIRFARPLIIDLGGIAKGYAVDRAFLAVCEQVEEVVINAGGDLRMKQWRGEQLEIKTPGCGEGGGLKVAMQETAVATTAAYYMEAGTSNIIDPATRRPLVDGRSVSVFAPSCCLADALTKLVLLADNAAEILGSMGASALFVEQDGSLKHLA